MNKQDIKKLRELPRYFAFINYCNCSGVIKRRNLRDKERICDDFVKWSDIEKLLEEACSKSETSLKN